MGTDRKRRTFGKASAWQKAGINVLHLRGTPEEMARQHGVLLKEYVQKGAIPYLGQKNNHLLEHSHIFKSRPQLYKIARQLIHTLVHKPMLAHVPRHYIAEAKALAAGAEIPYEYCQESMVQADTLVILMRYFMGRHLLGQMAGGFPGCTSVVAIGKANKNGGVIHARNMDYPTVGRWDTYPTVFYCDPEGPMGEKQRYISITTAGLHSSGVTSVNEAGLTLASHFHCAKAVSVFGTPIQFIGSEVIRRAKTLGQAVDIVSDFERAGTWAMVISSAKENDAIVIEMTHGKLSVRQPDQGKLVHTNHYRTPEFREKEVLLSASVANDYIGRYLRAMELLDQNYGEIDRGTVARILGDHYDRETGKVRSQGNTISVITTVTSMIAELSQGKFWVGNTDHSPTCLGDYASFKIDETFEKYDDFEPEVFSWSTKNAATIKGTPKEEAFKIFREAYVAFHTEYDVPKAAAAAERASKADPEEGHFHMAHGHFRMRLSQTERALEAFELALNCPLSPHMMQVARLFRAHALDCLGRREEAVEVYRELLTAAIDPHIKSEVKRCIRKPYCISRAEKITFDLQFCDSFEYA